MRLHKEFYEAFASPQPTERPGDAGPNEFLLMAKKAAAR